MIYGACLEDMDVVACVEKYGYTFFCKVEVRNNRIGGIAFFYMENNVENFEERIVFFLENTYMNNRDQRKVLLHHRIEETGEYLWKDLSITLEYDTYEKNDILLFAWKNVQEYALRFQWKRLSMTEYTKEHMQLLLSLL